MLRMSAAIAAMSMSLAVQAAEDKQFYLGATVGQANVNVDLSSLGVPDFDGDDIGYRVFLGYQFHKYFALEYAYGNIGTPDDSFTISNIPFNLSIEGRAYEASLSAILPFHSKFKGFLKAGGVYVDYDAAVHVQGFKFTDGDHSTEFLYGGGLLLEVHPSATVRLEYSGTSIDGDEIGFIGLGASWSFQ